MNLIDMLQNLQIIIEWLSAITWQLYMYTEAKALCFAIDNKNSFPAYNYTFLTPKESYNIAHQFFTRLINIIGKTTPYSTFVYCELLFCIKNDVFHI